MADGTKVQQKNLWLAALVASLLVWCTTMGLFLLGVLSRPWGWVVLLVLAVWAWHMMRKSG